VQGGEPQHEDVVSLVRSAWGADGSACAVRQGSRQLSHEQLDRRANQLGHALGAVARGQVVGLLLRDRLEQVVATLGSHKAGAIFAALEPRLPSVRLVSHASSSSANSRCSPARCRPSRKPG